MELYSANSVDFIKAASTHQLAPILARRFFDEFRFQPPTSEVRAWANSLAAAGRVIDSAALYDHGIVVEYQLPLTSRRLDLMITGKSDAVDHGAIVELKEWDYVRQSWIDGCVRTTVGMQERDGT